MGHISKKNDVLTEVNRQFACLARPCAIQIWQICGYVTPRPKKNSEKGALQKGYPALNKPAEMERLRLTKVQRLSPDFTHEIER
ncbi:hypothetical protein Bca4012_063383 [Brassica carinata]